MIDGVKPGRAEIHTEKNMAHGLSRAENLPKKYSSASAEAEMPRSNGPASLFRQVAVESRSSSWLGTTQAVQPWPTSILATLGAVLAASVLAFIIFGQYTQRVRVQGVLAPSAGLIKLSSPQQARVVALKVAEGDTVAKDDVLYVLNIDRKTEVGDASGVIVESLKLQRKELQDELLRRTMSDQRKQQALEIKIDDLQREMTQIDSQIATSEEYVRVLQTELDTYQGFLKRGITTQRDIVDRRSRLMTEKTQLEALRRDRFRVESEAHTAKADIAQLTFDGASRLSEIRRQISDADRTVSETEAQREIQITAPAAGQVTGVVAHAGQPIGANAPLLTIVPSDGTLQANLYAESRAIGFVRPGAKVMLRYAAYPYQKFGQHPGEVVSISRAALIPDEIDQGVPIPTELQGRGALYRLTVRPRSLTIDAYGKLEPLQPGMQVEADIYLDKRPIWQWILNPLMSLRSLNSDPDAGSRGDVL